MFAFILGQALHQLNALLPQQTGHQPIKAKARNPVKQGHRYRYRYTISSLPGFKLVTQAKMQILPSQLIRELFLDSRTGISGQQGFPGQVQTGCRLRVTLQP